MKVQLLSRETKLAIFLIASCIAVPGCFNPWPVYSKHNLDNGEFSWGGGGYRLELLEPGVYRIFTKTNRTFTRHPKTARKMWRDRAGKVCGSNNFLERNVDEMTIVHTNNKPLVRKVRQSARKGIVICFDHASPSAFKFYGQH